MNVLRARRLALAAGPVLVLSLVACAPQADTEGEHSSASTTETQLDERVPTPFPTTQPTSAPPDDVLDLEEGAPATYERTWTMGAWPSVPVPPSPTPRLTVTCAQLLDSASLVGVLRPLTVQPTIDTLALRQAGATLCSYSQGTPSGDAVVTLRLAVDVALGYDSAPRCSYTEVVNVPTACRGRVDVGSGSAEVAIELPERADPQNARSVAQALLDAGEAALRSPGAPRAVPAINPSAMGAGSGGCSPSTEQREALFSQVDSHPEHRDVYGGSSIGNEELTRVMHERVATTSCWWWLGWSGMQITVAPGSGWAVAEPGVLGTPVTVAGADSALRLEREVSSSGESTATLVEMVVIASARGSAVIASTRIDPSQQQYWRERLVGATEAIIGTQP